VSMTFLEAMALPDEYSHPTLHLCGLCGNHGIIDTVGKVVSPAGVECGIKVPCVCANGRAIKRGQTRALTPHKVRKPKVKAQNWWVSWEEDSWTEPSRMGPRVVSAWESGQAGDGSYRTVVAWVVAARLNEVVEAIDKMYPCEGERRWRFISPREANFSAGDRFPLNKQAQAKLKKLKVRK
jgi:hypothetical protein